MIDWIDRDTQRVFLAGCCVFFGLMFGTGDQGGWWLVCLTAFQVGVLPVDLAVCWFRAGPAAAARRAVVGGTPVIAALTLISAAWLVGRLAGPVWGGIVGVLAGAVLGRLFYVLTGKIE